MTRSKGPCSSHSLQRSDSDVQSRTAVSTSSATPLASAERRAHSRLSSSRSVRTTERAPAAAAARPTVPRPAPTSRTDIPLQKDGQCVSNDAKATDAGQTTRAMAAEGGIASIPAIARISSNLAPTSEADGASCVFESIEESSSCSAVASACGTCTTMELPRPRSTTTGTCATIAPL
eukprot:6268706-Prymnesium_polylepis.1